MEDLAIPFRLHGCGGVYAVAGVLFEGSCGFGAFQRIRELLGVAHCLQTCPSIRFPVSAAAQLLLKEALNPSQTPELP